MPAVLSTPPPHAGEDGISSALRGDLEATRFGSLCLGARKCFGALRKAQPQPSASARSFSTALVAPSSLERSRSSKRAHAGVGNARHTARRPSFQEELQPPPAAVSAQLALREIRMRKDSPSMKLGMRFVRGPLEPPSLGPTISARLIV